MNGSPFSSPLLMSPDAIAIDGAGNAWSGGAGAAPGNLVIEISSTGTLLSPSGFQGGSITTPGFIAIDGGGNVWVAMQNTISEMIGAAVPIVTPIAAQIAKPAAALSSIAVTPATASLAAGGTQQFTATGTYADGSTRDLTSSVTWATSNPGIATVSAAGLATGILAGGPVQISATLATPAGPMTGSATLTVTAATVPPVLAIATAGSIRVYVSFVALEVTLSPPAPVPTQVIAAPNVLQRSLRQRRQSLLRGRRGLQQVRSACVLRLRTPRGHPHRWRTGGD